MFKDRIEALKRKAAEASNAYREQSARNDADACESTRAALVEINKDLRNTERQQEAHEEAMKIANEYLQPAPEAASPQSLGGGIPPSVNRRDIAPMDASSAGRLLDKMDPEVVLSALNCGVKRASDLYSVDDREAAALQTAASIHNRAWRALVGSPKQAQGEALARKLLDQLPASIKNVMWTVSDDEGGFLAPPTFRSAPVENRTKPGVMRRLANVEPTLGDLWVPVIKNPTTGKDYKITDFTGEWVTEGNRQSNEQVLNTDQIKIATHEWQGYWIPITEKLFKNSRANVADIVSRVIVGAAEYAMETAFWTGDGVSRPEGLLRVGNSITAVNSTNANDLTYRGLRLLHFNLRAPYRANATYVMNSITYGDDVLGLESSGGTYVHQPNQEPMTLFGRPIEFFEDMDSVSANNHPIIFGDFREGYTIAEQSVIRIIRSDEKFIPQVGFLPTLTVGGKTMQVDAFVKQKVAA